MLGASRRRRSICFAQRPRLFALRSRAAACLRGAAVFFAEPLRAGAEARFAAFATGRVLAGACRFSVDRFSTLFAAALLAGFLGAAARGLMDTSADAVTFSGAFGGAVFVGLRTSLLVLTDTVCVATTAAAGAADAAFVLPFGRPPFLANWASANILRKASCASAISWTCETRRSRSALSFSARYIASAVVASIVNVWKGSTISTRNLLNVVENALSDRGSCDRGSLSPRERRSASRCRMAKSTAAWRARDPHYCAPKSRERHP